MSQEKSSCPVPHTHSGNVIHSGSIVMGNGVWDRDWSALLGSWKSGRPGLGQAWQVGGAQVGGEEGTGSGTVGVKQGVWGSGEGESTLPRGDQLPAVGEWGGVGGG